MVRAPCSPPSPLCVLSRGPGCHKHPTVHPQGDSPPGHFPKGELKVGLRGIEGRTVTTYKASSAITNKMPPRTIHRMSERDV